MPSFRSTFRSGRAGGGVRQAVAAALAVRMAAGPTSRPTSDRGLTNAKRWPAPAVGGSIGSAARSTVPLGSRHRAAPQPPREEPFASAGMFAIDVQVPSLVGSASGASRAAPPPLPRTRTDRPRRGGLSRPGSSDPTRAVPQETRLLQTLIYPRGDRRTGRRGTSRQARCRLATRSMSRCGLPAAAAAPPRSTSERGVSTHDVAVAL